MFLSLHFSWILKLVHFEILDKFSPSFFEICEFISFNQFLLSLFDISSMFHNSIWLNIKYNPEMRINHQINLTKFD